MKLNKLVIKFLFLFYCSTLAPSCSHVHHKDDLIGKIKYKKQHRDNFSWFPVTPLNKIDFKSRPKKLLMDLSLKSLLKNEEAIIKNNSSKN
jgi:hypothetical protein